MNQGWDLLLRPDHVLDLTDGCGILQHANGVVPAREHGYCVDDVARLVVVGAGLHARRPSREAWSMVVTGLSFLDHAITDRGMHNFMSYDRRWLEDAHLGDHVGRTVWALGEVVHRMPDLPGVGGPAWLMLQRLVPQVVRFDSPHEWAYGALGLARALATRPDEELMRALMACVEPLEAHWDEHASIDWPWPRPQLTYDNARFPQAIVAAGEVLGRPDLVDLGAKSLAWYHGLSTSPQGVVHTVGNRWLRSGETWTPFTGDEQPIDVGALCESLAEASRVLERDDLAADSLSVLNWFLGNNRLALVLYDLVTAGCHDGLGGEAVNLNQGAESTLAFLQAALAVERTGLPAPGDPTDVQAQ